MAEFDWSAFLRHWNDLFLSSEMGNDLPQELRDGRWLGFPPATDTQIQAVERRLQIPLPPSYKAFLKFSNGWHNTTFDIDRVWGTEEVGWFRLLEPEWAEAFTGPSAYTTPEPTPDEEYFAYECPEDFRSEHLKETLQISAIGDSAVYLLNPQVITRTGEWEAWFFANWLPGAHRYRSFQELMEDQYASFAVRDWEQPKGILGGLPIQYVGSPGSSDRRIKDRTSADDGPSLVDLLAALDDTDLALRLFPKARQIGRSGQMSGMTPAGEARCRVIQALERRGERSVLERLTQLLSIERDRRVRQTIIRALGTLGGAASFETLLPLLNSGINEATDAMYALKKDCPDQLIEPLLHQLESRGKSMKIAAGLLAELGEMRAVPLLTKLVEDHESISMYDFPMVIHAIAKFPNGLDTFKYLLSSPDLKVRQLAAGGISLIRSENERAEVRAILENLLNDADPRIQEMAKTSLYCLPAGANDGGDGVSRADADM